MTFGALKTFARFSCLPLMACMLAYAQCPVDSIRIKGRVEHLPRNASVLVQLFFAPDPHAGKRGNDLPENTRRGESAEAILDGATFSVPVEFVTNNRRPVMSFGSRCDRKPQTVVVTLTGEEKTGESKTDASKNDEYKLNDSKTDARHYILRSDLVLDGEGR
jgi:hypothetical protein